MDNSQYSKLDKEFDINFYISMNNDVATRFNFDFKNIKEHFFNIGHKEKRLYSKNQSNLFYFHDWIKYISSNKDILSQKINNEILAFKHYLEHGMLEKRSIFPKKIHKYDMISIPSESNFEIIDLDFCKKMNNQLTELNENQIIKFISDNYENRSLLYSINHKNLLENYDWNQYLIDYPDLKINKIFNKIDALHHYILFGNKEGRNIKCLNNFEIDCNSDDENDEKNNSNVQKPNSCLNMLNQIEKNDENLFDIFKNNILDNSSQLDIEKYNIKNIDDMHKIYEIISLDFDYEYYFKMNGNKFNLNKKEEECLEHFFNDGLQNYLPYSKNHYLLFINYSWDLYAIKNNLNRNNKYDAFIDYIKNKYYYEKNIELPKIKYPLNEFINEFYKILYEENKNILVSYKNFLKIEDENKLFPNLFNYFLYTLIDWEDFKKTNNLNHSIKDLIFMLKNDDYDFNKYKVSFNNISDLKIPDKNILVELYEFKYFYSKVFNNLKKNKSIQDIVKINNQSRQLFKRNLFDIPKDFKFLDFKPCVSSKNLNLSFNIIINYIHKFEALRELLISIFYQNFNKYKIIIINKTEDEELEEKIYELKKSFIIDNEIIILENEIILENLNIYKDILDNKIKFPNLKKYIKTFEINILINTNHYLENNNILQKLNKLYDEKEFYFENIIIEKKSLNNKSLNTLVALNSDFLFNNFFLMFNYYNYNFKENSETINNLTFNRQDNIIDQGFYNTELDLKFNLVNYNPIFILYEDKENLKFISNIINHTLIEINSKEKFDNFINYINDNLIFNYITIIFIDKILDKFDSLDLYKNIDDNYSLVHLINKKKKNLKKNSKILPKLFNYDAFTLNYESRKSYLNNNKS